ncbi:carbohydrate ABC transporter permease [Carnobacterium gallinarum]|uniref:carbohydrate ABC transporter permease n=1 Tax=Carnobacterium gallinarum TaxID=2749 RepID=UPI00055101F4|nr:carbohydrate ABC transporter permease [Carnobacterium gallinarum]
MHKKNRRKNGIVYLMLAIGVVIFIVPYIYMMIASTQNNAMILSNTINLKFGSHLMENMNYLLENYQYVRVIFNSLFVTIIGTLVSTFVTTLAGYTLAKYRFMANRAFFMVIMLSRMIPGFAILIPTFMIFSRLGLTNTYGGIILPAVASANAVFIMKQYADSFPIELIEAARIDGAGEFRIFYQIALPLLKPNIITSGLLIFMGYWNSYLFPLVMTSDTEMYTVPLVIRNITQASQDDLNYGAMMAVLATSVIPVLALYTWVQSKFKSTDVDKGIK